MDHHFHRLSLIQIAPKHVSENELASYPGNERKTLNLKILN